MYNNRYSMMDYKNSLLLWSAVILAVYVINIEGRNKKVIIHVPYKVKKINHVHTILKTIHHHHTHREPYTDINLLPTEEHEHFHHLHVHDDAPLGQHSQQVQDIGIPEFLPDVDLDVPLKIPDIPHRVPTIPSKHSIPFFKRKYEGKKTF